MTPMNETDHMKAKAIRIGLWALGGLAVLWGVRKIVSRVRASNNERAIDAVSDYDTNQLTFPEAQARILAEQLYNAMKDVGTDTDTIESVVAKLRTRDDWNAVVKAFGIRPYGTFGAPLIPFNTSDLNLFEWLRRELSGSLLERIESQARALGVSLI